jgi:16S rRNA (cytosine967-C5)-methyltransferase
MKITPSRSAAFDVLLRIERDRAFSSVLLPIYEDALSPPDRALCHELVLGVLRRQIYLDRVIASITAGRKLDTEVRIALRLGLYQLICLDRVPDYSAVSESVSLTARSGKASAKGLVNAALRGFGRTRPLLTYEDELDRLAVETSHPRWIIEKWATDLGFDDASRLANANNSAPQIAFRVTPQGAQKVDTRGFQRSTTVEGCFLAKGMSEEIRTLAANGLIYLQDEASQMVAAAVPFIDQGRFLDGCAAPGGKVMAVAGRILGQLKHSVQFVAGDLHEGRVRLLRSNCIAQGLGLIQVVQYDAAAAFPFVDASFDAVLIDAPCSGTGTIRHNPEIRYFLEPGDLNKLKTTQLRILANVSNLLKPGGTLIYSTCSLEREENEEVCIEFESNFPEYSRCRPNVPERYLTSDGFARTWPHRDDMGGFFIACFSR